MSSGGQYYIECEIQGLWSFETFVHYTYHQHMLCLVAIVDYSCSPHVHYPKISAYHMLLLLLTEPILGQLQSPSEDSHSESTECSVLGIQIIYLHNTRVSLIVIKNLSVYVFDLPLMIPLPFFFGFTGLRSC